MLTRQDKQYLEKKFVLSSEFKKFINEFTSMKDEMMFELKATREDQIVGSYRRMKNTDQLFDHDKRIGTIETKLDFSTRK